jgi:tetratricopeptide (TPR) repeat protein
MKKIIFISLFCPLMVMAQKEIKPSVSKAESALQKGVLDEAKAIIDATVASQEFMVDKKGSPSKNSTKAWYLRGLIYSAIDTTKTEKFKSLDSDPFSTARQSFEKCNCPYASFNLTIGMTKEDVKKYFGEPGKGANPDQWVYNGNVLSFKDNKLSSYQDNGKPLEPKSETYVNKLLEGLQLPVSNLETAKFLAQKFLERGYNAYKNKEYKKAFIDAEKVLFFLPNDTAQLLNVGVYFAPQAEENEKAINYINKYLLSGGKNPDAFLQMYALYFKMKDYDNALKAIKQLVAANPNNMDYLNSEYNIYVQTNNLPEAKATMLKRANADENDTESRYFLALIAKKMTQPAEQKHWIEEILKIDSEHFEANEEMSVILNQEARILNEQRNSTKDIKKRQELFNARFAKFKEILPYAEKCVSVKPTDENSLYNLFSLYENLSTYDESYEKNSAELKKKMKALGMQVD